jgi:hypothetical protein
MFSSGLLCKKWWKLNITSFASEGQNYIKKTIDYLIFWSTRFTDSGAEVATASLHNDCPCVLLSAFCFLDGML